MGNFDNLSVANLSRYQTFSTMEQEEPQLEPVPKSAKVQLRCPFPQCPKQLKWRSLKTHIRSIVENDGYDDAHPRTDTLWATPYVEKLLSTCAPKADNPEVQKARIKASSRKYYQKNRVGILLRKAKERENFRTQMAASLTCSPRNVSNSVGRTSCNNLLIIQTKIHQRYPRTMHQKLTFSH